jgi:hypothetical protein
VTVKSNEQAFIIFLCCFIFKNEKKLDGLRSWEAQVDVLILPAVLIEARVDVPSRPSSVELGVAL